MVLVSSQESGRHLQERWEDRWANGRIGWDLGKSQPALTRFLLSDKAEMLGVPITGKALIPGCGLGHDVLTFARRGLDATGLDISPTGAEAARKWLLKHTVSEPEVNDRTKITTVDFFKYHGQEYDLIYDFTFLCALNPPLRPQWAQQMSALARKDPSTRLITLMFPLNGNPGGPPFNLTEEIYHELLDANWELMWSEDVLPEERRAGGSMGGEKIAVWKRRA